MTPRPADECFIVTPRLITNATGGFPSVSFHAHKLCFILFRIVALIGNKDLILGCACQYFSPTKRRYKEAFLFR